MHIRLATLLPAGVTALAAGNYHSVWLNRGATLSYTWDRLHRLTSATAPDGTATYAYDDAHNWISRTKGTTTLYTYDKADRLTSAGGVGYTTDAFSYFQTKGLRRATVNGTTSDFVSNGDGDRVRAVSGSTTEDFVYALKQLFSDGTGKHVSGAEGLAYTVLTDGTVEVLHTDADGSVRVVISSCRSRSPRRKGRFR